MHASCSTGAPSATFFPEPVYLRWVGRFMWSARAREKLSKRRLAPPLEKDAAAAHERARVPRHLLRAMPRNLAVAHDFELLWRLDGRMSGSVRDRRRRGRLGSSKVGRLGNWGENCHKANYKAANRRSHSRNPGSHRYER